MRDVIQKIVATESEAKLIVETARVEADRILSEAQKKGRDIVDQARQEAHAKSVKITESATALAEQEKQRRLAEATVEIENQINLDQAIKKSAVEEVIRQVCRQT